MVGGSVSFSSSDPCCTVIVLYCVGSGAHSDATWHRALKAAETLLVEIKIAE